MDQRRILLLLMMRFSADLSRPPQSVELALERNVQNLRRGEDTPPQSISCCRKLTPSQYVRQSKDSTEMAIVNLIRSVIDDTKLGIKEKQKMIKQFNKHHPEIMREYFGDLA